MPFVLSFKSVDECNFINLYKQILLNEDIAIQRKKKTQKVQVHNRNTEKYIIQTSSHVYI